MREDFLTRFFRWAATPQDDRKFNLIRPDDNETIEEFGEAQGQIIVENRSVIPGTGSLFGSVLTINFKS